MEIDFTKIGLSRVDTSQCEGLVYAESITHAHLGQPAQDALLRAMQEVGMRSANFLQLYRHHYPACTVGEIITMIGIWSCKLISSS